MRIDLSELDGATIEQAGALMAAQNVATRQSRPGLPSDYDSAEACTAALQRQLGNGSRGVVAAHQGRLAAVMTATVREVPAVGRYARLAAEGFAADPGLSDPTTVLAVVYAELATALVARGILRHYVLHVAQPGLGEAMANLGFGRESVYAVQRAAPRPRHPDVPVRVAGPGDLGAIGRLAAVEIEHRSAPPMFWPKTSPSLAGLISEHKELRDSGAVHLIASVDGRDAGLLTIELSSPEPRLCPPGQPFIGPTATAPDARRRGVGRALADAALRWASDQGYEWVAVDFAASSPMSRPFWLSAGFQPTGYGLLRVVDPSHAT
jgi:GNAT superfamily N-acetyltransferase